MDVPPMEPDKLVEQGNVPVEQPQTLDHAVQPEQETPTNTEETPVSSPTYNHGYSNGHHIQYSSHSADYISGGHEEYIPSPQYISPTMSHQTLPQPAQPSSRPASSGLSSGGDRYGYSQPYQDQGQRQQAVQQAKNSVVIKVGMVGDAQIGKTSLMVKYVEGSWDEDYIQTLG